MPRRPDPPVQWRSVFYPPPNYPYFERPPLFAASPKIGKLNLLKAAWMADASALAYARSGPDPIPVGKVADILKAAGFATPEFFGDWSGGPKGTQAFFANTQDFAVLSFRGTEKDDWRDLAADLATWPVEEDDGTRQTGDSGGSKTMFHLPPGRAIFERTEVAVHRGFQAALNEVWQKISATLNAYRASSGNEVFFTGHSLGAALATLAISRFNGGNVSLYTFGSPRVGNSAFVGKLSGHTTLGHFRIVDRHDIVTRVPPALMFYAHAPGSRYQIDPAGVIHDCTDEPDASDADEFTQDLKCLSGLRFPIDLDSRPPDDIYDHSPGRYCNSIWNAL